MWLQGVGALALACAIAYGATPLVRRLALRVGALDRPVARSVHSKPTPRLGGLAICLAAVVSLLAFLRGGGHDAYAILGGAAVILAVGVIDDVKGLPAWAKLLGQIAAAAALVAAGVRVEWLTNPSGGMWHLPVLGIPITLFWVVAVINVVNLVDGLDGLAAGISTIAALTLMIVTAGQGQVVAMVVMGAVAGAALGFLPYNFNPAKIFMGDTGSMFLGYMIAAVSVQWTLKCTTVVALAVPVLALGLPIFDTSFAILRRLAARRPVHEADQEHLHHRLLRLGFTQRQVVVLMYVLSAGLGLCAVLLSEWKAWQAGLMFLLVVGGAFAGLRRTGVFALQRPRQVDR